MDTARAEIIDLLKRRIGLDTESIGTPAVEQAVRIRMGARGMKGLEAYREQLTTDPEEMQALVETVVVPETWFFRHVETFDEMVRYVMTEWAGRHGEQVLRALSIPCSTGEEPYSIAMALLNAGFSLQRLQVDAIDISRRALQHARAGLYRPYSFRNRDQLFRDRYFKKEGGDFLLKEELRGAINFQQGNALDVGPYCGSGQYDVVFCRNLLIYLDPESQETVVTNLSLALQPAGRLFSSPAEHAFYAESVFRCVGAPSASMFERAGNKRGLAKLPARTLRSATSNPARMAPAAKPPGLLHKPVAVKALAASLSLVQAPVAQGEDTLDRVARLADEGRLPEASLLCEQHMRENGESARGLYLLGLVRDTQQKPEEAEKLYRKTLYLEPNHVEALLHLAWLREGASDEAQAQQLRARARRAQERRN